MGGCLSNVGGIYDWPTGHFWLPRKLKQSGSDGKESASSVGEPSLIPHLGWENPLEKGMAIHFSILAWKIPWTEQPGRL